MCRRIMMSITGNLSPFRASVAERRLICGAMAATVCLCAPTASLPGQAPRNPDLRRELLAHRDTDQAIRDTLATLMQSGRAPSSAFLARLETVDARNTSWIKSVLSRGIWPGRSLVGAEGSNAAFLLVQHATNEPAFMAAALPLLESAVSRGDAAGADYALLFDRVTVAAGRRQRFGTQAKIVAGRVVIDPIEDSVHVDARRAKMGLPPLALYIRMLDSLYTAHPRR